MSDYDTWKTALPDEPPCKHERATHGSAALDADAAMLLAMGADPGPMECPDCGELVDHKPGSVRAGGCWTRQPEVPIRDVGADSRE